MHDEQSERGMQGIRKTRIQYRANTLKVQGRELDGVTTQLRDDMDNKEFNWDEMLKHQPFGWVRIKNSSEYKHVAYIKEKSVALSDLVNTDKTATASYDGALRWLLFTDDSPFGIKEEV